MRIIVILIVTLGLIGCSGDESPITITQEVYDVDGTENFLIGRICPASDPAGVSFSVYDHQDDEFVLSGKTRDAEMGQEYCLPFDPGIYSLYFNTPDGYKPAPEADPLEVARGTIFRVKADFAPE
ncbi:hypothetical protein KAR91_24190 [Candidatus Pacearchaeota archaeon]|nr:hypothetical protein [Candidatus Pacearchaeota archaeon]